MSDTPFFDKVNDDHKLYDNYGLENEMVLPGEPSKSPKRKVVAATVGSGVGFALAVVITWVLGMFGVDVPEEVQNAFGIIIVSGLTFVGGYWTKE